MPEYLLHCESRLAEEYDRSASYLKPITRGPLIVAVESGLIEAHVGMFTRSF